MRCELLQANEKNAEMQKQTNFMQHHVENEQRHPMAVVPCRMCGVEAE
jgi:hypothetical protein